MGTFVTDPDADGTAIFPDGDKAASPRARMPAGWTNDNVWRASEMNAVRDALLDLRADVRDREVNVKHYGAVGDGATDDTAAIQAALAAVPASGGRVLVPPGAYRVTSTVEIPANTSLRAFGGGAAVLNFSGTPSASKSAVRLAGVASALEDLEINVTAGDYQKTVELRAARTVVRGCKINVTTPDVVGGAAHYIVIVGVDAANPVEQSLVEGNDITASGLYVGDAVQAIYCPGVRIIGNHIHDINSVGSDHHNWGVYVSQQANDAVVALNRIEALTNLGGIHFNDDPSLGGTGTTNYGRRALGNAINGVTFVGISFDHCVGGVCADNLVRDTALGIKVIGGRGNKVVGNHVEYQHTLSSPLSLAYPYVETDSAAQGVVIANNTFGPAGTAGAVGVNVYGPDVQVLGNRFQADGCAQAIYVASTVLQGVIAHNLIPAPAAAASAVVRIDSNNILADGNFIGFPAAPAFGVRVAGDNVQASNNRITGAGNNGVFVASGSFNVIRGNSITSASNGISDSGTSTVKRDNVVNGKPLQASGRATFSGNGATTQFDIAHGLAQTPTSEIVVPASDDARILLRTSRTSTLIQVVFASAPAAGSSNVVLNWFAEVS